MSVEVRRSDECLELELTGEWVTQRLALIQTGLAAVDVAAARQVSIATQQLTALDLAGAWALRQFVRRARAAGAAVTFRGTPPDQLRLLDEILKEGGTTGVPEADAVPEAERALEAIGRHAVRAGQDLMQGLAFVGRTSTTFVAGLVRPPRLRPSAVARHVYDTGITAMPIVALIAFLISVIIAYMSARQLSGLGSDNYVVDLVSIGVLRELGVLLILIIVAGFAGSAFADHLGSMRGCEEIDAV